MPSKRRPKHRRTRPRARSQEPDYVAIGFRESAKFLRRGAREAKPYLVKGGKWVAPRAKVAAKKGAVLAGRGVATASRKTWDALSRLRNRKHLQEMEAARQRMIFEGKFFMRPAVERRRK